MAAPGGERVILTWEEARALYPGTADVAYLDRAAQLATLLEEAGITVHLPAGPDRRSGIMIASSPGTPHQVLYERLLSQGVRCSLRGSGLRFASHYFTTDSDLCRAADTLRHPA